MSAETYSQVTYICDNGGFESGFTHYTGAWASWYYGSNDCAPMFTFFTPNTHDGPSQWSSISLPAYRRFEIVSTGNDGLTGFPMVKKGSSSLKLNNLLSHSADQCRTDYDLNKIIKSFEVDAENRIFTIWYSVVFEHDPDHQNNSNPFFNIKCDLATNSELCIDFSDLHIAPIYSNHGCVEEDSILATNWVCHTIIIPEEEIGNTATLEIIAADCGCDFHFGYAYIDAICEPCDSSSFGGGEFQDFENGIGIVKTCTGDSIELCGTYYLPSISGTYALDSFVVPGKTAYNKQINTTNKTFCFTIEKSDFEDPLCKDIYAILYFSSSSGQLPPVISKPHNICYNDFVIPELVIEVGQCNRNNSTDNYFSDDYYYVDVEISDASYVPWVLSRRLNNPYDGESGIYQLKTGISNGTHILGPFLIQEGSWALILEYQNCVDTFHIDPPEYCSGCSGLGGTKITNIKCNSNNTWSYNIEVPYNNPQTGDYFKIGTTQYDYNETYTISAGTIGTVCREVIVNFFIDNQEICNGKFNICPPQKCSNSCDIIEAYVKDIICSEDGSEYYIDLEVYNATCYKYMVPGNTYTAGTSLTNPLGPFDSDMNLMLFTCSSPTTCTCSSITCYKLLYIHKPDDCESRDFGESSIRISDNSFKEVDVHPNPISSNEIVIHSTGQSIEYFIFNSNGKVLNQGYLVDRQTILHLELPSGLYYLNYMDHQNKSRVIKFVKF